MCDAMERAELKGRAEGRAEGRLTLLVHLAADGTITVQRAAQEAGMDVETFKERMKDVQ